MSVRPFSILPTIDGYDVIAVDTGRPVAHRDTPASANGVAYMLNEAARGGPKALAAAFKASRAGSNPSDPLMRRSAARRESDPSDPSSDPLLIDAGINGLGLDQLVP